MTLEITKNLVYNFKVNKILCNDTRSTSVHKSDHGMQIFDRCTGYCVFLRIQEDFTMPRTQLQRMMFALMTVIVTVHAYVFYSLYVVNGSTLMNVTGADSVLGAVNAMGGIYMLGRNLPIWAVVIIEFMLAYEHITELTPEIMHELIEKIVVHAPDKSSGHRTQEIEIHYRFNVAVTTAVADSMKCQRRKHSRM